MCVCVCVCVCVYVWLIDVALANKQSHLLQCLVAVDEVIPQLEPLEDGQRIAGDTQRHVPLSTARAVRYECSIPQVQVTIEEARVKSRIDM